jgi:hypothetical protein
MVPAQAYPGYDFAFRGVMRTDDLDDFEYAKMGMQTTELLMGDGNGATHKIWAELDNNV